MPSFPASSQRGFTLVEMAISIVIIGLLVGAVVVGRGMIRDSELQGVISHVTQYTEATDQFKTKYGALPGDMPNATDFWGTNPNCGMGEAGTDTQTCNGGGDERIDSGQEYYLFWQHLAVAGVIKGTYTGESSQGAIAGLNVPKSPVAAAYYSFPYNPADRNPIISQTAFSSLQPWLTVGLDGEDNNRNLLVGGGGVLHHDEALLIEQKIDDGVADSGRVRANFGDANREYLPTTCIAYDATNTTSFCLVGFMIFTD